MLTKRFLFSGPNFGRDCEIKCLNECNKPGAKKPQNCEDLANLRKNGCLANCPSCVYEALLEWMKCGKTLNIKILILI